MKVASLYLSIDDAPPEDPYPEALRIGLANIGDELSNARWGRQPSVGHWCTYDVPEPNPVKLKTLYAFAVSMPFNRD